MTAPNVINGMEVIPFEQRIAEARERVMTAVTEALDAELGTFLIPSDRVAMLEDFTLFACFFGALKTAEIQTPRGVRMDARDPLRAWFKLSKAIDKEVASRVLDYGREAAAKQMEGTNDAA